MRVFLSFLLILSCFAATAQPEYFNTEEYWKKLKRENTAPVNLRDIDTCIVLISNRAKVENNVRFMGQDRGNGQLSYFFVYIHKGVVHVLPVPGIKQALALVPHKDRDLVVYTEGMGKLFTSDIARGMGMAAQYRVNVIMFDYPSITTTLKQIGNYRFALAHAKDAFVDFLPVYDTLKQLRISNQLGSGHLTLFFHSMGNNVVREIVINDKLASLNDNVWVDNLVLNSACVPERGHKSWLRQIAFAKNIYVHYNPKDHTLSGAHLLSLKKELGEKTRRPLCNNVHYINFHKVVGKEHSVFLITPGRTEYPRAIAHYSHLLHGNAPDLTDTSLYKRSYYRHIGLDLQP